MASSCKEGYYFCNSSQKCKRIPKGHKVQSDGELVREYVSDWRSDLQEVTKEYIDKKQSQFKKDYGLESNPFNLPDIQKSNNEKLSKYKVGGRSFKMTGDGQNINFGEWGGEKVKEIGKRATGAIDKATNIATDSKHASKLKSHGTSADQIKKGADEVKSNIKKGASEAEFNVRRGINKHIKGTPEHQTVGVEKDIAFNTDKFKPKKKGLFQNKVVSKEELQGGISVEPYTKDTKFLEVETVDIIKPKALNASDWRSELVQIDEKYKYLKGGNLKNLAAPKNKNIKHGVTGIDYTLMVKNDKKKETVSASYNVDLENLILEIVEADIAALHENGFSYEEVAEFYNIQEDLSEGWGKGAQYLWQGLKAIERNVRPKVVNFTKKKAKKDIGTVVKFARDPKTWQRANKDIDITGNAIGKVGNFLKQLPARGYAGAQKVIQGTKNTVNALKPAVDKVKTTGSDLVKKTAPTIKKGAKNFSDFVLDTYGKLEKNVGQAIVNRGRQDVAISKFDKSPVKVNIWKDKIAADKLVKKGDTAGDVINVAANTGKKYKKPGDPWNWFMKKRKPLTGVPQPPVDRTNKLLTPGKTSVIDKLKSTRNKIADVGGKLATTAKDKGGALVSKVKSLMKSNQPKKLTGTNAPKLLTGTKTNKPKVYTGTKTNKPKVLTGTKTKQLELPISTKKKFNPAKAVKNTIEVGSVVAGAKVGSDLLKKDKTTAVSPPKGQEQPFISDKSPKDLPKIDPPKENKTIKDTEKKKVDPKKNPVVSKVVDTYKTGKETKSKDVDQWGRSRQYTAKDGTVVDRSNVFTKATFDFGPNIKKGEKLGVLGHGQRKKYDLEATRRKSVKESAALAKQLPKAFKAVSKLRNATKSNAVQKVFGGASALTGLSGMVRQSKKEDGIPSDINQDAPPDIQKQLDAPQDVRPRSRGEKILKDLLGTKKDPKAMKDKYDKDALDNAKTDSILDPTGTQKTKPTLDQLRKGVKAKRKYKAKSPEIERNQGTMTDKQIERMKKAGLI